MLNLFLLKSFAALDGVGGVVCSKGYTREFVIGVLIGVRLYVQYIGKFDGV